MEGLLDRLIFLRYGLSVILAFIGVKLILHALHENNVPFINGGEPVHVFEISTGLSLGVILGVLAVTVVASLLSPKGRAQNAVSNARRHALQYLDLSYEADQRLREKTFEALQQEEEIIRGLPEKYRRRIRDEHELWTCSAAPTRSRTNGSPPDTAQRRRGPGTINGRRRHPRLLVNESQRPRAGSIWSGRGSLGPRWQWARRGITLRTPPCPRVAKDPAGKPLRTTRGHEWVAGHRVVPTSGRGPRRGGLRYRAAWPPAAPQHAPPANLQVVCDRNGQKRGPLRRRVLQQAPPLPPARADARLRRRTDQHNDINPIGVTNGEFDHELAAQQMPDDRHLMQTESPHPVVEPVGQLDERGRGDPPSLRPTPGSSGAITRRSPPEVACRAAGIGWTWPSHGPGRDRLGSAGRRSASQ